MAEPTGRLAWLDLARGLAVVSMIFAHTWPWGGPWAIVEYLSAPWFALLIGVAMSVGWRSWAGTPARHVAAQATRGVLLVGLGLWLQGRYEQIVVVLPTLGVLIVLLAVVGWLIRWRTVPALVLAAAMAVASPVLAGAGRVWLATQSSGGVHTWLVDLLFTGYAYRVSSFLGMALAGVAVGPLLTSGRAAGGWRALLNMVALFGASASAYLIGGRLPDGARPYSGSTAEIVGATLLSLSATWFCWWLAGALGEARTRALLGALMDTGRMALSAYTLQVLGLAAIVALVLPGQRDDHWWVTLQVSGLCIGSSWLWLRFLPQGPVEILLRLPGRRLRRGRPVG